MAVTQIKVVWKWQMVFFPRECSVFARAAASDVTSNNLASANKIIIIDCDTPAYNQL